MNEFNKLYSDLHKLNFSALEKCLKAKKISTTCFVILLILGICLLLAKIQGSPISSTLLFFTLILFMISFISMIIITDKTKHYITSDYYNTIISAIIQSVFPNAKYSYTSGLPERTYRRTNLFNRYDIYNAENYISTNLDGELLELSEIETILITRDSEGDTTKQPDFIGVAAHLHCFPNIDSDIRIVQNLSKIGRSYIKQQFVKLDSELFENFFDVICDNQITAMQFLTSDVMEKFLLLLKKTHIPFEIYIQKSTGIYFRFFMHKFLDINTSTRVLEFKTIRKHYLDLLGLKEIIYQIRNFTKNMDF